MAGLLSFCALISWAFEAFTFPIIYWQSQFKKIRLRLALQRVIFKLPCKGGILFRILSDHLENPEHYPS